jgi:hypothetical protein
MLWIAAAKRTCDRFGRRAAGTATRSVAAWQAARPWWEQCCRGSSAPDCLLASPVIVAGGAPLKIEYLRTAQGEVRSEAGAVPQL